MKISLEMTRKKWANRQIDWADREFAERTCFAKRFFWSRLFLDDSGVEELGVGKEKEVDEVKVEDPFASFSSRAALANDQKERLFFGYFLLSF